MALTRWKSWPRRHKAGALSLLALAVAAAGWAWRRHRDGGAGASAPDKYARVSRGDLVVSFKDVGEIAAKRSINVASKVSGRVTQLPVQEGSLVAVGQKLAVIQPGRTETERYLPSAVLAPIPGVVMRANKEGSQEQTSRFTEVGDYVTGLFESQNPTYLMTIADMRELVVKLKISELDILKLSEKMPVTVSVDAVAGSTFPAVVSMISPQAEKEPSGGKIFRVEVLLLQADPRLRTGMTARVDATLQRKERVLKVPLTGVFELEGEQVAFVAPEGRPPVPTRIRVGLRTELDGEVLAGLKDGERLLTEKPADFVSLPKEGPTPGAAAAAERP